MHKQVHLIEENDRLDLLARIANIRTRTPHLLDLHEGEVKPGRVVPRSRHLRRVGLRQVAGIGRIFARVEFHGIYFDVFFDADSLAIHAFAGASRTCRLLSILHSLSFCINVLLF